MKNKIKIIKNNKKYLAIIGTAFPELHGATKVTEFFFEEARKYDLKIRRYIYKNYFFDKNKTILNSFKFESKLSKLFSFIKICLILPFQINTLKAVYIQENAGLGKFFDIFLLLFFILFKKKCFYHNHSYKKLYEYDIKSKIIQLISRYGIENIFLHKNEASKFLKKYGKIKYRIISNSVFINKIDPKIRDIQKNGNIKLGLISNLTKEKGLDDFLNIAKKSLKEKNLWEFELAGPLLNNRDFYLNQIKSLKNIKYYGQILEENKKIKFFNSVDFFIFLTSHQHESEPLVILEAISNGCIPITYNRGSIIELIPNSRLIIKNDNDIYTSVKTIIDDTFSKREFRKLSNLAFERFISLKNEAINNLVDLLKEIKKI